MNAIEKACQQASACIPTLNLAERLLSDWGVQEDELPTYLLNIIYGAGYDPERVIDVMTHYLEAEMDAEEDAA